MKTISLKIAEPILNKIDQNLVEYHFTTRTEFIREAIRDKLEILENQRFEAEIRKVFKERGSEYFDRDVEAVKEDVFEELERRFKSA